MNIRINISPILAKAWKITWKYKILWIFGILASFNSGGRSSFNNSGGSGGDGNDFPNGDLPESLRGNWQDGFFSFLNEYWVIITLVTCAILLLSFFFYFLGTVGKVALIHGTQKADLDVERLTFGELWGVGVRYFWRMFGLALLVGLPIFIVVMVLVVIFIVSLVGMGNVSTETPGALGGLFAALGIFIPAICCLAIVSIFINMILEQAKNAMVIKDLGIMDSLREGWDIFKNNFLTIIILSILLGVLGVIVSTIVSLPLLLAVIPAIAGVAFAGSGSADQAAIMAPLALAGLCFCGYLPVLLFFRGVLETYNQAAITLTYLRLTAPTPEPPSEPELVNAE
jgi:hypothetical protein